MKHFLLTVLPLLFVASIPANAYDFSAVNEDGKTIYYNISGSKATVTYKDANYGCYSGNVVIPETVTYKGTTCAVTKIDHDAFAICTKLTSVSIPESVTSIGSWAFYCCSILTQVNIPNGVTGISKMAFAECEELTSLTIPESVTSIGECAFAACTGLTSLSIPNSVTTISGSAFYNCAGLTGELVIPNSVTSIGEYAFYGCTGLTQLTIGSSVTSIGKEAFAGCSSLTSLTIEDSEETLNLAKDTYAADQIFSNCPIETLYLGRKLNFSHCSTDNYSSKWYYYSPFRGMNSLAHVIVSNNVKSIEREEFYGCTGLIDISIPESVTTIGESAFHNCKSLIELNLPNSVTSIGDDAFYGCSSMIELKLSNNLTRISSSAFQNCSNLTSVTIPESVTSIGSSAFYGCSSMKEITIPNSVTSIGSSAYGGCTSLTSLTLEDGETTLTMSMSSSDTPPFTNCPIETLYMGRDINFNSSVSSPFKNNPSLTSLTIGEQVTDIPSYSFSSCTGLMQVFIGNSVASIGSYAFRYCAELTSVTIPNSVTSVGTYAFSDCTGLTSATIGNSVTSIGEYAFYGCSSLTGSLAIPNSVTEIGNYAFADCSGLTEITIPNSVTTIGESAFYRCTGLAEIIFGNSVTEIDNYAFEDCTGLTEMTIPSSVTSIGAGAFRDCTSLKTLTFEDGEATLAMTTSSYCTPFTNCPIDTLYLGRNLSFSSNTYSPFGSKKSLMSLTIGSKVTKIAGYSFEGCLGLEEVTIPNSVTSIGYHAFRDCTGLNEVTIGNSVKEIDSSAFRNCTGLTSLTIPNSVTTIGGSAFAYCTGLRKVTIGESVTTIDSNAFYGCSGLTEITIPNSVTSIGEYAFSDCSILTTLTIEDGGNTLTLTTGSSATPFTNCPMNTVYLGRNLEYTYEGSIKNSTIAYYTSPFRNKTSLTSLTISNSVTKISREEFYGCTRLKEVIIPNSVTSIGESSFSGCSGLKEVTIGNSVETIGSSAFYGCTGLMSIYSINLEPPTCESSSTFYNVDKSACVLYVPKDSKDAYSSAYAWRDFKNIEESDFYGYYLYAELVEETDSVKGLLADAWSEISTNASNVASDFREGYYSIQSELRDLTSILNNYYFDGNITDETAEEVRSVLNEIGEEIKALYESANESENEFLYNALGDEIKETEELLSDTWETVTNDCVDVANEFTETYKDISTKINALKTDVDEAYVVGELTDETAEGFEDRLDEIKQEIETLLADAKEAEDKYLYIKMYEELVAVVEATNESLSDAWTTIETDYPDMVDDLQETRDGIAANIEAVGTELEEAYATGELTEEKAAELREELATIEQEIEDMLAYASQLTGIAGLRPDNDDDVQIYDLSGRRVRNTQSGNVYIFHYLDGTSKKVLVK